MKIINKLLNFGYTLAIVFCLVRLADAEQNNLAKVLEILLAITTVVKAVGTIIAYGSEDSAQDNAQTD